MTFAQFLNDIFTGNNLAMLGAVLAAIFPFVSSAKAIGNVGVSVVGSLTEDPSKFGKLLILQALPGTNGIYGLMIWAMFMFQSGYMNNAPIELSVAQGFLVFISCLPMVIVGYSTAMFQGKVVQAGVHLVSKRPEEQAKAIVLAAMIETYVIFALLVSILSIMFIVK